MADLREKRVELILQQLEELPTLPSVAVRVLQATGDETSDAREVVELIASDPALTARILQLVRRSDVGVRGDITTIERAVVLLGFDAIRTAVLAVSVFQTFGVRHEPEPARSPFSREAFWTHCLATACCAELLAEQMAASAGAATPAAAQPALAVSPSDAFICGLLHDLGKVAHHAVLPKSFSRVVEAADLLRGNIADVERSVIGLDHLVVGKRLAERWQLPTSVRDCVWLHGQPPDALPATVRQPRLVNLVTLADILVRAQHLGYSGNYAYPVPRQVLLDALGLSPAQGEAAVARLVERTGPRAAALGLGQTGTGELYQQALAQANREFGRVSAQLATKNQKLTVRSHFFDVFSAFQAGLRPDAAPTAVLTAVAAAALNALSVDRVAAFSLGPGQDYAEIAFHDRDGRCHATELLDLPGMSRVTARPSTHDGGLVSPSPGVTSPATAGLAGKIAALPTAAPLADAPPQPAAAAPAPGDGPVLPAGNGLEWFIGAVSPRLPHDKRFWICLEADGACIGGVVWGAPGGEAQRLSAQARELTAIANAWSLALRTAQIREEARNLAEQLADSNRRLHEAQSEILRTRAVLAVGEMASGAAHELNNPLMVISGRSQLLAQQLTDPRQQAAAQLIHEQSHRLSDIITDLMSFARPEPPALAACEVADTLAAAVRLAKARHQSADRTVEVTMGETPDVLIDAGQVSAALAEVIDNALHATDPAARGGCAAVHAAHDPLSQRVVITVADDGCGMEEDVIRRAFDPFYSHKPAGRRRGMGLAKALRWIEASGGAIRLDSRPGRGTTAVVLLPACQPTAVPPAAGATHQPPLDLARRAAQ